MLTVLIIGLLGCGAERGPQEAPEGDISYSGYILASPDAENEVFDAGTVDFTLEDGTEEGMVVAATQTYPEQYPGYWEATLPPESRFQLRLEGEGSYPSVWLGQTPATAGTWLSGVLFAAETTYMDSIFALVSRRATPIDPDSVQVWGIPSDADGWLCEKIVATGTSDGLTVSGNVTCLVFSEDGTSATPVTSGALDWFFVTGLPPGEIEVSYEDSKGFFSSTEAGDIVMALWFSRGT